MLFDATVQWVMITILQTYSAGRERLHAQLDCLYSSFIATRSILMDADKRIKTICIAPHLDLLQAKSQMQPCHRMLRVYNLKWQNKISHKIVECLEMYCMIWMENSHTLIMGWELNWRTQTILRSVWSEALVGGFRKEVHG